MTTTTTQVIGTTTTYHGPRDEHPYLNGYRVRIAAVIKGACAPGRDPDADCSFLTDDGDIARAGGVTPHDRLDVQPWLEKEGRFSFVSSDARAVDLACFATLGGAA